jgi:RNA polymerase sigma-70 factor, ECF subfamily
LDFSSFDDAALLAAIAGANGRHASVPVLNRAVAVLYERYGKLVYSIAYYSVGDVETAEEITQDVFLNVCKNAHTYRTEKAKVSSWLASIARHRAIDELRRRNVRPEKDQMDWPADVGSELMHGIPAAESPEQAAETNMDRESLLQMISALPPDQRQALALAFFKGLSHHEISDFLGEPLGTIKSRIRLAMQKLRERMIERGMIE